MKICKEGVFKVRLFTICVLASLLAGICGCGPKLRDKTGKFSEAEVEAMPFAQRDDLPQPSGGLVLSVGGETITADEIAAAAQKDLAPLAVNADFRSFREKAKLKIEQAVVGKVTDILLYKQAKTLAPSNMDSALDKAVENAVDKFVASHDGNRASAQDAIEKMGLDWDGFRDQQKRIMLTQWYISQEIADDSPVTHSDMLNYYESMKESMFQRAGKLTFRLIDIVPEKLGSTEGQSPEQRAMELAQGLLKRIDEGEDFGELAKEFSHGHRATSGGLWENVTSGSLAAPYNVLEVETGKINAGVISGPIETNGHVFIVKLVEKVEELHRPFEDVQEEIEAEIRFRRKVKQYNEMVVKLMDKANVANMGSFVEFCVQTAYRRFAFGGY